MNTKLTLRLENDLIEIAKSFAQEQQKPLSQIVADYFKVIAIKKENQHYGPLTSSLIGLINEQELGIADYKKHIEKKYLN